MTSQSSPFIVTPINETPYEPRTRKQEICILSVCRLVSVVSCRFHSQSNRKMMQSTNSSLNRMNAMTNINRRSSTCLLSPLVISFLLLLLQACSAHTFADTKKRNFYRKQGGVTLEKPSLQIQSNIINDKSEKNGMPDNDQLGLLEISGGGGGDNQVATTRRLSSAELALAGAVATMIGDASMHPIDCIKTLQQSVEGSGLNMIAAAKKIFAEGGVSGFYSGLGTYVVSDGLAGSIKFATYEAMKHWVNENVESEEKRGAALFVVAGLAFVASSFVLVPGELIKQRLQMGQISSVAEGFATIWKNEGIRGFFTGYSGVCLRDVPYTMMELGIYENLKTMYVKWKTRNMHVDGENYALTQWDEIIAAAITGGVIGYATAPLDNIKTKLMVDVGYSGFFDCVSKTIEATGFSSLFNGGGARVAWLMPFTAIYLPIYEVIKRRMAASCVLTASSPLKVKGGAQITPLAESFNERLVQTCSATKFGLQRGVRLIDNARYTKYY